MQISKHLLFNLAIIVSTSALLFLSSCGSSEQKTTEPSIEQVGSKLPAVIKVSGTQSSIFFVDENNQPLFGKATFYNAHDFYKGYCVVSKMIDNKELRGIIDSTGKEVIPCTHEEFLDDVDQGMIKLSINGHYGYMDITGKTIIPCIYTNTKGFSNGMVKLEKDYKKWGILDKTGKEIIPFNYEKMGPWGNDMASVKLKGKWGFINKTGELVIPAEYDFAWGFEQGVSLVGKGKKYGLINTKNEKLADLVYDNFKSIVDVSKNEFSTTGYSESNERVVMEEGLIIFSKDKLWGLMDTKGEVVLPYEHTYIGVPDANGIVNIEKDGKRGTFNLKTKAVKWY